MTEKSKRPFDIKEHLITKYASIVYRLALSYTGNRYDAEDVMQEVFCRYVKSEQQFESEAHEKAWFLRVTINCSKSFFSSFWHRKIVPMEHIGERPASEESPEEYSLVYDAVMALPAKQRLCIHLFYYENLSIKEISKYTGIKESTVKSHMHRAKTTLNQTLKGVYQYVE